MTPSATACCSSSGTPPRPRTRCGPWTWGCGAGPSWGPSPPAPWPATTPPRATDGADRAWIYGGFAGPQFRPDTALGDLWELDLAAGAWRPLPGGGTPPPPTTNAALAFHEGALYLLGGHDGAGVTPGFWRYDLALQEWQALPAGARPAAWTHHARSMDAACADLLLLGGDDADGADVPDLEAFRLGAGPTLARLSDLPPGGLAPPRRHGLRPRHPAPGALRRLAQAGRGSW